MLVNLPTDLVEAIVDRSIENNDWQNEQFILNDVEKIVVQTIKIAEDQAYG